MKYIKVGADIGILCIIMWKYIFIPYSCSKNIFGIFLTEMINLVLVLYRNTWKNSRGNARKAIYHFLYFFHVQWNLYSIKWKLYDFKEICKCCFQFCLSYYLCTGLEWIYRPAWADYAIKLSFANSMFSSISCPKIQ